MLVFCQVFLLLAGPVVSPGQAAPFPSLLPACEEIHSCDTFSLPVLSSNLDFIKPDVSKSAFAFVCVVIRAARCALQTLPLRGRCFPGSGDRRRYYHLRCYEHAWGIF